MRIAFLAVIAATPALAHSWYPLACCGNMDCFPVTCDQLVETRSGWLYVPTGNLRYLSLIGAKHSLFSCIGNLAGNHLICCLIRRKTRSRGRDFAKFPVNFPVIQGCGY